MYFEIQLDSWKYSVHLKVIPSLAMFSMSYFANWDNCPTHGKTVQEQ